ncbi:MAG: bifunctional diaminohydroxyphosphoribosylaminopyrimidine deaminase/5-amino-6-(5-phosphoribosylamino)uracil reductase RibD [Anaerostipes sp.]|nr:bifunctional diaminohydroxyphosphoribosylaminopyrimidine deaminase/5-amino-6-(5-phosphoribosylamino)uracil reductase RibD [Anaerostipes sp.]MDD3745703.1 bifunctional diaminohydroxyphosphoribosylaminopyrimidine deaminase/5-amino-6-(5-phosphoribosylamino)uracil reductase RibD [Anaerostipes sp.]
MKRAIFLAKKARGWTNPNPLVGAVVVKDGRIIGEGYHERYGQLHAERNALANCKESPEGATIYVTLEPCCHYGKTPPCTQAIIENKLKKVVIGSFDPNPKVDGGGIKILREHGIEVETECLKEECDKLNDIFFYFIKHQRPYIALKYAMTMDGKIATVDGESQWITGEKARAYVQHLRHEYAGIMVGIGTVLADNPMLTARIENGNHPTRIVCDSKLRIPIESQLVKTAKEIPTMIATLKNTDIEKENKLKEAGCQVIHLPEKNGHISMEQLIVELGKKNIDSVLVEGGGIVNGTLVKEHLVQKVYAFIAPKLFGGKDAKTPIEGSGIGAINEALKLEPPEVQMFGNDILLESKVIDKCLQES